MMAALTPRDHGKVVGFTPAAENTLRDLVETHRELARESSVYEDVRVDVEELAALLDVAEAARARRECPSCRMCDTDPPMRDALDRLIELNVIVVEPRP